MTFHSHPWRVVARATPFHPWVTLARESRLEDAVKRAESYGNKQRYSYHAVQVRAA